MYSKEYDGDIRALFSGAYVLTADNFVVCVVNHYYENELEFETLNLVGGMSDAKDIIAGKYSSETCLKREFKEALHDNEVKGLVFFSKENYKEIYNYEHKKQYMPELFEKIFCQNL